MNHTDHFESSWCNFVMQPKNIPAADQTRNSDRILVAPHGTMRSPKNQCATYGASRKARNIGQPQPMTPYKIKYWLGLNRFEIFHGGQNLVSGTMSMRRPIIASRKYQTRKTKTTQMIGTDSVLTQPICTNVIQIKGQTLGENPSCRK